MNIVMFLSLFFSTMSVVVCALVKQWCQEYKRYAYPRAPPHKRGRVRTYLFNGLEQFQMRRFIYGVQVALHISVFLFFWAVSDFLYNIYQPVGNVARYCLLTSLVVYAAFSISPLVFINSPYHTALTPPIRGAGVLILIAFRVLLGFLPFFQKRSSSFSWLPYFKGIRFDRTRFLVEQANERAENLDKDAMEWLLTEDYLSDTSMDKFLESLPGYIHSHFTNKERSSEQPNPSRIIKRIREHFLTCTTSHVLSEEACITRVSACVNSLRLIFKPADSRPVDSDTMGNELRKGHIQDLVNDLNARCDGKDQTVALRASCVRGLAFQGLLTHLTPPDVETTPTRPFPDHLLPLYTFFCGRGNNDSIEQQANSPSSTEARDRNERMWKAFLNDGPLVNLTFLADIILSHGAFHPQGLPLCWKTLDALLKEFGIARMDVSDIALAQFNKVLDKAHEYHQMEHRGFRIMPLLEILDTVARGRHLSMVFLHHPRYYGRADVVFGKEQLQNSDLMEAFASCLPGYIDIISQDERRDFMEGMVCDDDLWTSLQVNLWKAVHLESSVPGKQRIFEACCTVIDAMFLALEDSDSVNWRAPEFGSLSQHFELFVTTCFKGTFVGRATGLRVGLIKLRFCDALLTKFCKEVNQKGAVSLRLQSQWDVASLARVFYTLEVGGEEDMAFWKSFASGGDIGADFIQKAREMLDATIRDGPLLNFCKLGHLAVTAVPFAGSGLGRADIKKVQELQTKVLTSPLDRASVRVWRKLNGLEDKVRDASTSSSGEEKDMLKELLLVIKDTQKHCPFSAQQLDSNPDEPSTQTPPPHSSSDDDTSTHNSTSAQPEIHDRIPGQIVKQIDIIPFATSLVPPRPAPTRRPSRRRTEPANLSMGLDGVGLTANAGPHLPTVSDASSSSQSTSLNGPGTILSTLHEDPESIGDQSIVTLTFAAKDESKDRGWVVT
jgi:hypothetical protein